MIVENVSNKVSVSDQIDVEDLQQLHDLGVEILVCNRPDGEAEGQTSFNSIEEQAKTLGIAAHYIPFAPKEMSQENIDSLNFLLKQNKRLHAYCRTGNRSKSLFLASTTQAKSNTSKNKNAIIPKYDIVIVGAGSAGLATAASLRKRNKALRIAVVDSSETHYYQPGWTMVGGGAFNIASTSRDMKDVIPKGVKWIKQTAKSFKPEDNTILLGDDSELNYEHLIVAPGLILNWSAIEGLEESLGKNGVTSNYRYDLAPYTWQCVQNLNKGRALFTQPAMPIKCAGAPQKAMYLSCSEWFQNGKLNNIDVEFFNSGNVLFGVADYVPALESYVEKYQAKLNFSHNLIKVDGENQVATFETTSADGKSEYKELGFDMLHVCPPQSAPEFIKNSPLSDENGWLDVNPQTLRHSQFDNIWGVGDVMNTANAKTMAAARKQAPVVAENIVHVLSGSTPKSHYDGYGSCPLTVEKGKIVLAEFAYGGKLAPTLPKWLLNGTKATKLAWFLKAHILPGLYWRGMLKGHEWFAKPNTENNGDS